LCIDHTNDVGKKKKKEKKEKREREKKLKGNKLMTAGCTIAIDSLSIYIHVLFSFNFTTQHKPSINHLVLLVPSLA
jgi:hypothetical protein